MPDYRQFPGLLLLILILAGCSSSREFPLDNWDRSKATGPLLTADNFRLIEGTYCNRNEPGWFLWRQVDICRSQSTYAVGAPNGTVRIKMPDAQTIELTILAGDSIQCRQTYSGRVQRGLFVITRQRRVLGLPPLAWIYQQHAVVLGLDDARNLLFSVNGEGVGFVTIMPLSSSQSGQVWNPVTFRRCEE
jgi:hypothetical protein